jgi:hypothetical protein
VTIESRPPGSGWKYAGAFLAIIFGLGIGLYLGRGPILAALVRVYLYRHGIEAQLGVYRLDSRGFTGWVRVGKPSAPDFSVERIELTFATPRFGARYVIPQINALRLVRPQLRVAFDGKKLSFGSLQPIVDLALSFKSGGGATSIAVTIDRATVRLSTPAGEFKIAAAASVLEGGLIRLSATLLPAKLQAPGIDADIASGTITADMAAARLNATATVSLNRFSIRGVNLVEGRAAKAQVSLEDTQVTFSGDQVSGVGRATTDLTLSNLGVAGVSAATVSAHTVLSNGRFAIAKTNWNIGGPTVMTIGSDSIRAETAGGEVYIQTVRADFEGSTEMGPAETNSSLRGAVTAVGGLADSGKFALAIAQIAGNSPMTNSITEALRTVRLALQDLHVDWSPKAVTLSSGEPGRILGANDAQVTLSRLGDAPLLRMRGGSLDGAFKLNLTGSGLPKLDLAVGSFRLSHDDVGGSQLEADADLKGRLDTAQLHHLELSGGGHLIAGNTALTLDLKACAAARAEAVLFAGHSEVSHVSARLCPDSGHPLFTSSSSGWGMSTTWTVAFAAIDAAASRVSNASGRIRLKAGQANFAQLEVARAEVSDSQSVARFAPIAVAGNITLTAGTLASGTYRGEFAIEEAAHARKVASIAMRHSTATDAGDAVIDTTLRFDPSGLLVVDLLPLAAPYFSRLTGDVSFHGQIAWADGKVTSSGLLTGTGLVFRSPAGAVKQAALNVRFDSLLPPVIPPGQTVSAHRVDSVVPLEQLSARFSMASDTLQFETVEADAAEGRVSLDPFRFAPGVTTEATMRMQGVNLGRIVADSGLARKVKLTARIDGVVPISVGSQGLRVSKGHFAATEPGRLSISRDVWTGAAATGGAAMAQTTGLPVSAESRPSPNAIQDFAYQALENLAFEQLDGTINSLPHGRLGLLFHIKGKNDPPTASEARVGIIDLIRGRAFDKPLPLPKGTRIELTLETSINLDDLLAAYRGSHVSFGSADQGGTRQNEGAPMGNQR